MPLRIATLFLAFFLMGCDKKEEQEPSGQACGGVTATQCPEGQSCREDDPSDTCDPTKGGVDCPRICK